MSFHRRAAVATAVPDFVPTLSPGRHRNPRKGACFMEMASFLAGERWSDHPRCTHPLLAGMAREINDRLGDAHRQDLVPLIPSVVGLTGDDPRINAWIARESALTGLPVVAMQRQRSLAVGLLRSEAALADRSGGTPYELSERACEVLARVPDAHRWASSFIDGVGSGRSAFSHRGAPAVVQQAVAGISQACVPNGDEILVDLLRRTIVTLRRVTGLDAAPHPSSAAPLPTAQPERWDALLAA